MKTQTKHSGRIEVKPALKVLAGLQATYRAAWESACKHEGIPVDSQFVIFSNDNPFVPFYEKARSQYVNALIEYKSGGYIGLKISQ